MTSIIDKLKKKALPLICCLGLIVSNSIMVFAGEYQGSILNNGNNTVNYTPKPARTGEMHSWIWDEETKTLNLNNANITDIGEFVGVVSEDGTFPDDTTIIVSGDSIIEGGTSTALSCIGDLNIKGDNILTLKGARGISATSVSIDGINIDISATSSDGIYVQNTEGDAKVILTNVTGNISGGRAGIYVNGECENSEASVAITDSDLDIISRASGYNGRAQKSAVTVYVESTQKVETNITIENSKVNATGADAGLTINNYFKSDTNDASSTIDITDSIVTAHGTNGTWSGIFASVLGEHPDADSIITIKNSSVYSVSPNTGILTSSQQGESKIILDNSILGASGKTALSMIEDDCQVKTAELKNGSTYVQMTPAAVMKGTISNFDGKTIIATAGDGITYDMDNNYYIIPQGSEVEETFTGKGTVRYTFEDQAGGIGGFDYEKEEIWGYDKDRVCEIVETGVRYKTLKAAVEVANSLSGANTIKLLDNIDFKVNTNAVLTVSEDLTIIGDYTISRGGYTGNLFKVPVGVKLTLSDGVTFDGSNNWTLDEELFEYNLVNRIQASSVNEYITPQEGGTVATAAMFNVLGTLEMNDVVMQNNYTTKSNSGIAYLSGADAILITNGTEFKDCASTGSSTIVSLNKNSKWYINDGTNIHDNFVGGNGGICYISSSNVYMSGGIITHTRGYNANGTVFMMYSGNATLNMTGGTICENYGTIGPQNGRNAAVYLHSTGILNMTGGSICHNIGNRRGGIDSYKSNSTLNINRVDQEFIDGKPVNENGVAAYNTDNHPYIGDNVSLIGESQYDVGYNVDQTAHWWVTGGIYTQDVDEFCAEGYTCIPYDETERTDDYIVVPGYRVRYYSVVKEEVDGVVTYTKTLEKKYIHMIPKDKFWYELDERVEQFILVRDDGYAIKNWYTDIELTNAYDFENKLTGNLDLFGEYKISKTYTDKFITSDDENNLTINLESYIEGETVQIIKPKPADIVLIIDQSGSMARSIDESNKLTKEFLYTEEAMKNGEIPFYYVAYGNSTACGLWCNNGTWYYYDTYQGKNVGWDNHIPDVKTLKSKSNVISDTLWNTFEKNGIWQTRYGATYDAINNFLNQLSKEEADHRVAIVGFGSADDGKTELFINGEDTDYLDMTDEIAKQALKSVKTEFDSIKKSSDALWPNSKRTNAGSGLGIANSIYKNTTYSTEERDRIVILFSDGEDQKNTNPYENSYKLKSEYGAHIYTIKAATASPDFLQHMSSNYPDAKTSSNLGEKWYNKYFLDTHNSDELMDAFGSLVDEVSNSTTQLTTQSIIRDTISNLFKLPDGITASNIKDKIKVYTADYLSDGTFSDTLVDITNDSNINIRLREIDGNPSIEVTGFNYSDNYIAITNGEARGKKLIVKIPIITNGENITGLGLITNDPDNSGIYNGDICIKSFEPPKVDIPATVNIVKNTNGPIIDKEYVIDLQYDKHSYVANGNYLQSESTNETNEIILKHSESFELPKIVIGGKVEISNSDLDSVKVYKYIDGEKVEFNEYTLSNGVLSFTVTSDMEIEIIDDIFVYAYIDGVNGNDSNDGLTADSSIKTFKQAYTNLPAGGTIYVVDRVNISSEITLDKDKYISDSDVITTYGNNDIVISRYSQPTAHESLAGFTHESNNTYLINITSNGSVVIQNITLDGHRNAVETGETRVIANGVTGASIINSAGTLELNNCILQNNMTQNNGGAIRSSGSLVILNSNIHDNQAGFGGAVYNTGDAFIDNTILSKNKSTVDISVDGTDDESITQSGSGGAIYNSQNLVMTNSQISNNESNGVGGAIYNATENSELELIDTEINYSKSNQSGAAIFNKGSIVINSTTTISNNKALNNKNGAGIYNANTGDITINNIIIKDNEAGFGAGIYNKGHLVMIDGIIDNNHTTSNGAGINNNSGGILEIKGGKIINNESDKYGGGINTTGASEDGTQKSITTISGGEFYGNEAKYGAAVINYSVTNITGGKFHDNSASEGGGVVFSNTGCELNISNTEMYDNYGTLGGAIFTKGETHIGENIIRNNTATKGGAIYKHSGSLYLEDACVIDTNNDIYLIANQFVYAKDLVGNDIVARLTPSGYTNGRTVVRLIPNENYEVASDLISRFELTPSGNKALRPGDYIVESKNILDTDIIISELFNVIYDKNTSTEVENMPTSFTVYWCESASIENVIPIRVNNEFLGWSTTATGDVMYNPGDDFFVDKNTTLYAVWELTFALDAHIVKLVGDKEPIFRAGQLGHIVIDTVGDITDITVTFPKELTDLDSSLDSVLEINASGEFRNKVRFTVPLNSYPKIYKVIITAYHKDGETLSVERELQVIDSSIIDDLKTIIR